ncbi:hypothetical protein [Rufibacter psychrotolerans]|uniref:hypothetical protein n=1 Tax=Rufibacter psychrotolerans TaxID=2812556 RepID=UPI0019687DB0|nr:hypothetical protein [Rufibacter sp. SYSU D00308]
MKLGEPRVLCSTPFLASFFTLIYALLLARLMPYHELWFDETEPWLLALYSNSYAELLQNKVYEGHPNLWYSLLFVITRFTQDLKALQVGQFAFAVGFVFVFLRWAPFNWLLKLLFCFGYYGLFEYGLISRLYAMELLTTFLVCAMYPKRFSRWYLYIFVLLLNAHTHLFGLFFSGLMGLLLFAEARGGWKDTPPQSQVGRTKLYLGTAIWALGCLLALWSIARPAEAGQLMLNLRAATRPWQAFFPIPHFFINFWNSYILTPTLLGYAMEALLSGAIILFVLACFRVERRLFLPFLALLMLLSLFFAFKYMGSLRHFGHYFLFTVAFTWLLSYYRDSSGENVRAFQRLQALLLAATVVQFGVGVYAIGMDLKYPFHQAKETAAFLKERVPASNLIALEDDILLSAIVAYYGQPLLYVPELKPSSFFQPGSPEENELTLYQILDWTRALAQKENRRVILVSSQEADLGWYPYPVKLYARFDQPSITAHTFYLYQVDPTPLPKLEFVAGTPQEAVYSTKPE